jgi:hypothetical protein
MKRLLFHVNCKMFETRALPSFPNAFFFFVSSKSEISLSRWFCIGAA